MLSRLSSCAMTNSLPSCTVIPVSVRLKENFCYFFGHVGSCADLIKTGLAMEWGGES